MLTSNLNLILSGIQVLLLSAIAVGVGYFFRTKYNEIREKQWLKEGKAVIEKMPKGIHEGFGFVKDGSILLKRNGVPYIFPTYQDALAFRERFNIKTRVVYQNWDLKSKLVFVAKVNNGTEKR